MLFYPLKAIYTISNPFNFIFALIVYSWSFYFESILVNLLFKYYLMFSEAWGQIQSEIQQENSFFQYSFNGFFRVISLK